MLKSNYFMLLISFSLMAFFCQSHCFAETKEAPAEVKQEETLSQYKWTENLRPRDLYFSGYFLELNDKLDTAKQTLEKEYKQFPTVFSAAIQYGLILFDFDEIDKARTVWSRAVRDFSNNSVPKVYKAWVDAYDGRYQEAKEIWYGIAKEKSENSGGIWLAQDLDSFLGLYVIKSYLPEDERKKIGELVLPIARKYDGHPKFAPIVLSEYLHEGKLKTAGELISKILAKYPNEPVVITLLGIAELMNSKHEEALKLFDEAIKIKPNSPTAHLMRARVLSELKRKKESMEELTKAIELDPTWSELKEKKKKFLAFHSYLAKNSTDNKKAGEQPESKNESLKESKTEEVPVNPAL